LLFSEFALHVQAAIITVSMFPVYVCYLVFQLFSHKNLYEVGHGSVQQSVQYHPDIAKKFPFHRKASAARLQSNPAPSPPPQPNDAEAGPIEEEEETPQMDIRTTIALLVVVTVVCRHLTLTNIPRADREE
jgi:Ca2+:H+ antiporter